MTHAVLGELGTQPLHSAFSQGYEVRPCRAGSQPSVTHHVMKYKLADKEGEKGKGTETLVRVFPSIPLMPWQSSSATHLDIPHLFYFCRECTVLFTCHVSLKLVREGLEHLEFWAAVLQHLLFKEGETLFSVTSALSCQIMAILKPFFLFCWLKRCMLFLFSTVKIYIYAHISRENMLSF